MINLTDEERKTIKKMQEELLSDIDYAKKYRKYNSPQQQLGLAISISDQKKAILEAVKGDEETYRMILNGDIIYD